VWGDETLVAPAKFPRALRLASGPLEMWVGAGQLKAGVVAVQPAEPMEAALAELPVAERWAVEWVCLAVKKDPAHQHLHPVAG
jgi:hypothetical protein